MKYELGRCLLDERLRESGKSPEWLANNLLFKTERIYDFMENKRVMPLKIAISVAETIGCEVQALYELVPQDSAGKGV